MTRTVTAPSAYAKAAKQNRRLMAELAYQLRRHAERQDSRPMEWGFAGDLEEVNAKLAELVAFLTPAGDR